VAAAEEPDSESEDEAEDVAKQALEWKALRVLGSSTLFLTVLDSVVLKRYSRKFTVDGFPRATEIVIVHFVFVGAMCTLMTLFSVLQLGNIVNDQLGCPVSPMALGSAATRCDASGPLGTIPWVVWMSALVEMGFMLFYCIVEYVERQIDFVLTPKAAKATAVSGFRRAIIRLRAHWAFRAVFAFGSTSLLWVHCVIFTLFIMYVVLGAAVQPEKMLPVLLAIVGVFVMGTQLYKKLKELVDTYKKALGELADLGDGAKGVEGQISEVLREVGLSPGQVAMYTFLWMLIVMVFFVFVLLGCGLFLSAESIIPALVSGFIVISTTVISLTSGTVPTGYIMPDNALTQQMHSRMAELQANADEMEAEAKKLKEAKDKSAEAGTAVKLRGHQVLALAPAAASVDV